MINIKNNTNCSVNDIHIRCIAHVVNLSVKDCLSEDYEQINQIKWMLSAIRSSVKRFGIFEKSLNGNCQWGLQLEFHLWVCWIDGHPRLKWYEIHTKPVVFSIQSLPKSMTFGSSKSWTKYGVEREVYASSSSLWHHWLNVNQVIPILLWVWRLRVSKTFFPNENQWSISIIHWLQT